MRKNGNSGGMETVRPNTKLNTQITFWEMLARVGPVLSLFAITILWFVDFTTTLEYFLIAISIAFAFVAITWWWWIMIVIKTINTSMQISLSRFEDIGKELKDLKKDLQHMRK